MKRIRKLWHATVDLLEGAFLNGWQAFFQTVGYYRLIPIEPGVLYRTTEMPPQRLVALCRAQGVRTVIDLRRKAHRAEAEAAALEPAGIRHVHLPSAQVPDASTVAAFLELMDDPANGPVVIHCVHGVGRTGALMAVYLMEYRGLDNESARRAAKRIGGFQSFGRGRPKGEFVLHYAPRPRSA
ncbi:dual specificity protein phosphatase family protein [Halorhodospira halophila]|uniref:Dual specificity protein phosphatase n=1 Tax=Halorhodospira halophila (strain DSM 244 / SL1) TaxID=349124 RepID=A1WV67_HALHL|nr:dual specificity protein phosphatase family protein [Halorhodospira halophila]ABM61579.1 dual specificity protein phosphatase [Halorhodospira halophila SL1]MBK1728823.1 hypothetical protein [Halorhodospira halophila]